MPQPSFAFLDGVDFDRGRLYETCDLEEARERCARVFNPHTLRVVGVRQRLHSRMDHLRLGAVSLNRLSWGAAVAVDPDRLASYYLLSIPVRGEAVFHHGGRAVELSARAAGLVSAAPRFHFMASSDFEQVVVRFERASVDAAWQALAGRPADVPIDFACGVPLDGAAWRAIEPALQLLVASVRGDFDRSGLRHLAARVEDQLLTTLLLHQPHSLADAPSASPPPAGRTLHVRRAEEWMRERLDEPLTLACVARACGVAARTLQAGFHDANGIGPMQWLRRQRLAAVRAALLAETSARPSIAQTALRFGFTHLGEFSRAYRAAFGETPSRTLARRG